jgi:TPR repeat protein
MIFLILGGAVAGYFYFSSRNPDIEALMAEEGAAGGASLDSDASSGSNNSLFSSDASSSDETDVLANNTGIGTGSTSTTSVPASAVNTSGNEAPQMSATEAFSLGQELEMSGSPADMAKALDAYLIAGEQGMASAQLRLGIFYFEGLAGAPDYTKASEWYLKAAERGRPEAQFYLACMALQNIGPKNELNNPAHWLREASDQQYSNAQVNLALLYLDGAGSITRDPNIAAMLLRQAAEQGNPLGQALLGMLYDRGESVEEDPVQAENWYRKAVERDPLENPMDVPGLPPVTRQTSWEILKHAQKVLATKILETTGINSSNQVEEAKKLLESAAETNDPQAQFNLGLLYCDSSLSETDYSQARKWFQEAASSNYPPAWVNLGWMYENGYGVDKDVRKAEENYINAVNSGDALAQYRLGLLYLYEGDKSSGDEIKAYHWIKTAASNGITEAATKLQEWEQELSAKGANLSTSAVEAWRILDSLTEFEIQSDPNSQALELENNNSSLSGYSIVSVFKLL